MTLVYMLVICLLGIWIGKLIVDMIWNLFLSPLSSVPGPKFAAVTRLLLMKQKASGDSDIWRMKLHRKYGDVVRVAPNEISFATESAWKSIYANAPGSPYAVLRKDPTFYIGHARERSLISAEDVDHNRQRKGFSPAFSEKALRAQEPLIKGYIAQLLRNIESKPYIDMVRQYNFTTLDIMADLAFGEPLGCLETSEYISWIIVMFGFLKTMAIVTEINQYPLAKMLLNLMIPPSLKEKRKQHFQFSSERVDKRLSQQNPKTDIWHFVLAAEEKDIKITHGEMHSNASLFMIAGTETSATLLSALTYYLVSDPGKLKILTQEIRGRFNTSESINAQDVLSLKYLTACANEAFRMHPPAPQGLPRLVSPGGIEICGYKLPEGTSIYVHQLSIDRNPNNFIEPDTYLPERWLSEADIIKLESTTDYRSFSQDEQKFANDKRGCFQPFSIGPRNCIGQNLAWLEIRLIMTSVLWHFDLELCDESKGWDEQKIFSLWVPKPLMIKATPVHR